MIDQADRMMGTRVPASLGGLGRDLSAVAALAVPFEALSQSQRYRRGELTASGYAAEVVGNTAGLATVTAGGALAGVLLSKLALPVVAGVPLFGLVTMTAGMVAYALWKRTADAPLKRVLASAIPAAIAKPIADGFTRWIANPLYDHLWKPLLGPAYQHVVKPVLDFGMRHPVVSSALAFAAAPVLPGLAGVIAMEGGLMAGSMAAGMKIADKLAPMRDPMPGMAMAPVPPTALRSRPLVAPRGDTVGQPPRPSRNEAMPGMAPAAKGGKADMPGMTS